MSRSQPVVSVSSKRVRLSDGVGPTSRLGILNYRAGERGS